MGEGIVVFLIGAWFVYAGLRWGTASVMLGRKPSQMFGMYRAINVGLGALSVLLGLGGILGLVKLR